MSTGDGWTPEQRRAAAADLCERAARMLRSGDVADDDVSTILDAAAELVENRHEDSETDYHTGLANAEASPADIDTAVAALLAGSHPPDSLPGRLSSLAITERAEAQRLWDANMYDGGVLRGRAALADAVLDWIGCPTPPTLTPPTPKETP